MVYFARVHVGEFKAGLSVALRPICFIKIGHSNNPPLRCAMLSSEYGYPVSLLGAMHGGRAEELEMHKRFSRIRVTKARRLEWFYPTRSLEKFVRSVSTCLDNV